MARDRPSAFRTGDEIVVVAPTIRTNRFGSCARPNRRSPKAIGSAPGSPPRSPPITPFAGLILEAPYTSIANLAAAAYPVRARINANRHSPRLCGTVSGRPVYRRGIDSSISPPAGAAACHT
jgi:hypothetical protein